MPTVIILSSSPPAVFARSPTPADLPGTQKSSETLNNGDTPSRKRFKTAVNQRDGFGGSFATARQVLGEKSSEVNKVISSSPGRNKFKLFQNTGDDVLGLINYEAEHDSASLPKGTVSGLMPIAHRNTDQMDATANRCERSQSPSPLIVQRAVSRRIDWTPPRPDTISRFTDAPAQNESTFPNDLLGDFGYKPSSNSRRAVVTGSEATKRQKLDSVEIEKPLVGTINGTSAQILVKQKAPAKRTKSPTKKSLTITGLATSNFLGHDRGEKSPMVQYLTSTQERQTDEASETGVFESKVKQTKAAVAKIRKSKKGQPQSLLVSPSSAMRLLNEQEAVFGSASQLVTTGSKAAVATSILPDQFSLSDPLSSPPLSQAKSIESTAPQTGISRFRQSRNLWAAAGRDEDNALLHIDTIDLTDSPDVREALAGKDVMVQPSMRMVKKSLATPSLSALQPSAQQKHSSVFDIDDSVTPSRFSLGADAGFHTIAHGASSRKRISSPSADGQKPSEVIDLKVVKPKSKKSQPKKPHFAGLSDHDLKKQITAYGFKAIKKREKMVELLEKCWTEKYGTVEQAIEPQGERSGYGDILSHIHDVSARPTPKMKKITKPRKKKDDTIRTPAVKKPRQRKTKSSENKTDTLATKVVRKRKSKGNNTPGEDLCIVEDLDDPAVKERRELERFDDWARPPKISKLAGNAKEQADPATPPHSYPETLEDDGSRSERCEPQTQVAENSISKSVTQQGEPLPTPADSQQPDIYGQITRAINHESFTSNVHIVSPAKPSSSSSVHPAGGRNHQTNPTWHEKILLYDPIILEDLATWLNTKGFGDIGEDREVSAVEVRTWCETRGICCLWKGGWRGQKGGE